jgi:hypothetical protein
VPLCFTALQDPVTSIRQKVLPSHILKALYGLAFIVRTVTPPEAVLGDFHAGSWMFPFSVSFYNGLSIIAYIARCALVFLSLCFCAILERFDLRFELLVCVHIVPLAQQLIAGQGRLILEVSR